MTIKKRIKALIPILHEQKTGQTLYHGDLLLDFFDQYNNMVNPLSDAGFFLYNLFGKTFDNVMENINQMLLNLDPVSCDLPYLDIIANEFRIKRQPQWSDSKWRAVVIYYYYHFETIMGIEFVLNQLCSYINRDRNVELDYVTVNYSAGFSDVFLCSDKWDIFGLCSDKNNTETLFEAGTGGELTINFGNNYTNKVIDELLQIVKDGGLT